MMKFLHILLFFAIMASVALLAAGDSGMHKGTIYGQVFDAKSGKPISSAFVLSEDGMMGISDAEGRFVIEGDFAPSRSYTLTCYAANYPSSNKTVTVNNDGPATINFYLGSEEATSRTMIEEAQHIIEEEVLALPNMTKWVEIEEVQPIIEEEVLALPNISEHAESCNGSSGITITVGEYGCDYLNIQKAIDKASPCDTIVVQGGVYYENIVVNKPIILRGVKANGELPVIDAQGIGSAVILKENGIVLESFSVTNAGTYPSAGIEVVSSDNIIIGCTILNSGWWGIYLKGGAFNNTVANNIASNSGNDGIMVFRSPYNRFVENTVVNNGDNGIQILESEMNIVEMNVIDNNANSGISLEFSENSTVKDNVITHNSVGIQLVNSGIDRVGPNRFLGNGRELGIA